MAGAEGAVQFEVVGVEQERVSDGEENILQLNNSTINQIPSNQHSIP